MSKVYTAQERREMANAVDDVSINYNGEYYYEKYDKFNPDLVRDMLRYAAETQERCEKVIARCNEAKDMNSPTWTFDSQAFAMDLHEIVNYILRGDAEKGGVM